MRSANQPLPRPASNSAEQSSRFGTVVRALWPTKPALNLAQRVGCSERGAQYLIDGERRPSAKALAVIVAELVT
jgi:hypothetical protein